MNGRIGFLTTTVWWIAAIFFVSCTAFPVQKQFHEDIIATSGGDLKIRFIGHGTLMLEFSGKVIHVDPISAAADYSGQPKADLILVTHEHGDHLDRKAIDALSTAGTVVVAAPGCAGAIPSARVVNNGESTSLAGLRIEAVPAYNLVNKRPDGNPYHPKGRGNGYVVTFGDKRVYIAGDTENTPEMKALERIDVAFLPMNLPFTMTPGMAADAAKTFRPRILYPYHFGNTDTAALVDLLKTEKDIEVRIRDMK